MSVATRLRRLARRLPRPVKLRLKAANHSARRAASRASRTRFGSALFDAYLALRSTSGTRRIDELLDRSTGLPLSSSAAWFRLPAQGARRYLLTLETAEDLEPGSKAALVQYRFISE